MAELRPERITALRQERGLSQAALAREIGVGQSTIVRLEAGGTRNPRELLALAKALGCSPDYLLGLTDQRGELAIGERQLPFKGKVAPRIDPDLVELDEIDFRYGLGGTFLDTHIDAERHQFSRTWLRNFTNASPDDLYWARGEGDSMEPTIRSGELILIDASQKTPRMAEGIWVVAMGEIGMIKRLRFLGAGRIELASDNPVVPPIPVAQDEMHVIGRVVAIVRRL